MNAKEIGWAKKRKYMRDGHAWLEATHQFQLRNGDDISPEIVTMTGRAAKEQNKEFDDAFLFSLNRYRGPSESRPRLKMWVLVKQPRQPKPVKPVWIP